MVPSASRVREVWERHDSLATLPCTDADVEVVGFFYTFWENREGESTTQVVDFGRLSEAMSGLVSDFEEFVYAQPHRLLRQLAVSFEVLRNKPCHIRLTKLKQVSLSNLKAATVGRLVSVRAEVTRVGPVRPLLKTMDFKCGRCELRQSTNLADGKYSGPPRCSNCSSVSLDPVRSTAKIIDMQSIHVQQFFGGGEDVVPQTLEVELIGSQLVDQCAPGDVVDVAGVVKSRTVEHTRKVDRSIFLLYLEGMSLHNVTRDSTTEDAQQQQDSKTANQLIESLCPAIHGHTVAKFGLLLGLFSSSSGGAPAAGNEGRKNSHVLLVGDPGLGKSQLLRSCAATKPRSMYVGGNTASTTGLTISMTRTKQGPVLQAGALVLTDRGACCVDELDKMDHSQHASLLEVMEQQQLTFYKAGLTARLSARVSILAAANAVLTPRRTSSLNSPLLSRFDLIIHLQPHHESSSSRRLYDHIIQQHNFSSSSSSAQSSSAPSTRPLLRQYVRNACLVYHPSLTRPAAALLRSAYLNARDPTRSSRNRNPPLGGVTTMRLLQSFIRLAKARARMEQRVLVQHHDAADTIALALTAALSAAP